MKGVERCDDSKKTRGDLCAFSVFFVGVVAALLEASERRSPSRSVGSSDGLVLLFSSNCMGLEVSARFRAAAQACEEIS